MRKILVSVVVLFALLFGCLGGPAGEPFLVPDKADGYVMLKPSSILSDQDFINSMKEAGTADFEDSLKKAKEEMGFDPYSIKALTIFFNTGRDSTDSYGAAIAEGQFDKTNVVGKLRERGELREEEYGGTAVYYVKDSSFADLSGDEVLSKQETAFSFVTDKQVVYGSPEAVKDCIDVKSGKRNALKDEKMEKALNAVDTGAVLYAVMRVPESVTQPYAESGGIIDTNSLSKATYAALSYNKAGSDMSLKISLVYPSAPDSEKAKNVVEGLVSVARGFSKSGSATGKMLESVKVSASGEVLKVYLDFSKEIFEEAQKEWAEMASGQLDQPVDYSSGGYGSEPAIGSASGAYGDIIEFYGEECPHCQNMVSVVSEAEKETGVSITKLETWNNAENQRVFEAFSGIIEPQCGGLGVPTFYNQRTGAAICGEVDKATLVEFINSE